MRNITKTLYTFDELNESAQDRARDWYRQTMDADSYGADFIVEDANTIASILGITIATRAVPLMNGSSRREPEIYWSLDRDRHAVFAGSYYYAKQSCKRIREHAPKDATLHAIADDLQRCQRTAFYRLSASINYRHHSRMLSVDAERTDSRYITDEQTRIITECIQSFADWIIDAIEAEYEYQNADEQIDENIRANEYEFYEDGSRA